MSGNINGQQELSQILNAYKDIVKTSGGNVDSIKDEDLQSIFMKDLDDKKIDFQFQENGETKSLFDGIDASKVPQDKLQELTNAVIQLAGKVDEAGGNQPNQQAGNSPAGNQSDVNRSNGNTALQSALRGHKENNANAKEARAKYNEFQALVEKGNFQEISQKYANDQRFQTLNSQTTLSDTITSEEQRQQAVLNVMSSALLEDIVAQDDWNQPEVHEIEVPSIKQPLSDEEQKLVNDIKSGKLSMQGFGTDPNNPLTKLINKDPLSYNRVANAIAAEKIKKSKGTQGSSPTDKAEANKPATNKPAADKPTADANKPADDANKPASDANKPASDANKPNQTSGKDGTKFGIKGYENMTQDEKKQALRDREAQLEEEIKAAKEEEKANPSREATKKREDLQAEKKKAHKEYRTMVPSFLSRLWSVAKIPLGLVTGIGSYVGIPSTIVNIARIANQAGRTTEDISDL